MAVDTNSSRYNEFYKWADHGMSAFGLPLPNTGTVKDLWWMDPFDYTKGLDGRDPVLFGDKPDNGNEGDTPSETAKRFLWMPRKYGIPVAIAGVVLLGFGIYKMCTKK